MYIKYEGPDYIYNLDGNKIYLPKRIFSILPNNIEDIFVIYNEIGTSGGFGFQKFTINKKNYSELEWSKFINSKYETNYLGRKYIVPFERTYSYSEIEQ